MAEESFFGKLANDVFEATEQIAARLEEGLNVLMTGDLPGLEKQESRQEISEPTEEDLENLSEEEVQDLLRQEMMMNSPLEGIADGVLGDIMKNQVRATLKRNVAGIFASYLIFTFRRNRDQVHRPLWNIFKPLRAPLHGRKLSFSAWSLFKF
jgi:hypothetical protein